MISLPHSSAILLNRCLLHQTSRPISNRRRLWIRSSSSDYDQGSEKTTIAPSPSTKRVVLVRHGQSTWNEEGRIQGSSDFSVLTKKGENQADISRQMLIDDSFDVCFTRSSIFLHLWSRFLKSTHLELNLKNQRSDLVN